MSRYCSLTQYIQRGNNSGIWLDQKKGIDKLIETTKGWTRLNIVGAI
jgi:23S rRNA G2069 N7-methylase RlmK/C1962 C5-methylase RlmI